MTDFPGPGGHPEGQTAPRPSLPAACGTRAGDARNAAYNPRLAWLNRKPRQRLVVLYASAYPVAVGDAGLLTTDQLKKGLLAWAEGRRGVASLEGLEAG